MLQAAAVRAAAPVVVQAATRAVREEALEALTVVLVAPDPRAAQVRLAPLVALAPPADQVELHSNRVKYTLNWGRVVQVSFGAHPRPLPFGVNYLFPLWHY